MYVLKKTMEKREIRLIFPDKNFSQWINKFGRRKSCFEDFPKANVRRSIIDGLKNEKSINRGGALPFEKL